MIKEIMLLGEELEHLWNYPFVNDLKKIITLVDV